jgi:hypothetical protein
VRRAAQRIAMHRSDDLQRHGQARLREAARHDGSRLLKSRVEIRKWRPPRNIGFNSHSSGFFASNAGIDTPGVSSVEALVKLAHQ